MGHQTPHLLKQADVAEPPFITWESRITPKDRIRRWWSRRRGVQARTGFRESPLTWCVERGKNRTWREETKMKDRWLAAMWNMCRMLFDENIRKWVEKWQEQTLVAASIFWTCVCDRRTTFVNSTVCWLCRYQTKRAWTRADWSKILDLVLHRVTYMDMQLIGSFGFYFQARNDILSPARLWWNEWGEVTVEEDAKIHLHISTGNMSKVNWNTQPQLWLNKWPVIRGINWISQHYQSEFSDTMIAIKTPSPKSRFIWNYNHHTVCSNL